MIIFFEAQTGIYKSQDWESDYYHYRLDSQYSWSIRTSDWLDENILDAHVGACGLVYTAGFLKKLATFEDSTTALDESAKRLGIYAPQKIL